MNGNSRELWLITQGKTIKMGTDFCLQIHLRTAKLQWLPHRGLDSHALVLHLDLHRHRAPAQYQYASPQHVVVHQQPATTVTVISAPPVVPYNSTLAVVNLVFAILGVLCCISPISIAAIVFAAMALSVGGNGNVEIANRYAKVSLWLNIINFVIVVGVIIAVVLLVTTKVNEAEDYDSYWAGGDSNSVPSAGAAVGTVLDLLETVRGLSGRNINNHKNTLYFYWRSYRSCGRCYCFNWCLTP